MNKTAPKERKLLSPKLDVVFQKLFGEVGSEEITKNFLESILKRKISEIDLSKNPILRRETINDKLGILDVIAKIDGKENCDIEIQMANNANIIDRILFYWSKLYIREIKIGEDYKELEKAIVILLSNEKITDLKDQKYHTKWQIIETENRKKILTDKLEIHIIEIEKIKENQEKENEELITWLNFLENPESEEVKEKMENNKTLKKAKEKLSKMSEDEYMQRIAEWREKAILDENTNKRDAYENGVKDGIEQGRAQGMAQGIEQGIAQGIEQGIAQGNKMAKIELVKNMLKENVPTETISKISKLNKEEIEKIKKNIKD